MQAAVRLWSKGSHACLPLMCLSIILTRPLSPNVRCVCVCVHFLSASPCLLSFNENSPLLLCLTTQNVFLSAPLDPMNFPVWYFNLFLLLAPVLLFLPQFFLPMARSHATFTPSSLLLCCSLLHLLISLFFTSFQHASLKSPSLFLPSVCSSDSASFILQCCTYCSLLSLSSFSSSPCCPMSLS